MVDDDAGGELRRLHQLQRPLVRRVREETHAAAEDEGRPSAGTRRRARARERLHERAAAGDEDAALTRLEPRDAAGTGPCSTVVLCQQGSRSVVETTYFGIAFILSAKSPSRFGQASAKPRR